MVIVDIVIMVVEIAGRDGDGVLMLVHHPVPLRGGGGESGDGYMV